MSVVYKQNKLWTAGEFLLGFASQLKDGCLQGYICSEFTTIEVREKKVSALCSGMYICVCVCVCVCVGMYIHIYTGDSAYAYSTYKTTYSNYRLQILHTQISQDFTKISKNSKIKL